MFFLSPCPAMYTPPCPAAPGDHGALGAASRSEAVDASKTPRQGGTPPNTPAGCDVLVGGLPLVGSRTQRCCRVQATKIRRGVARSAASPHERAKHHALGIAEEQGHRGRAGDLRAPKADWDTEGAGDAGHVMGMGAEMPPRALQADESTNASQQVACFPSFIIAGTQKSGTTALTGERVHGPRRRHGTPNPRVS